MLVSQLFRLTQYSQALPISVVPQFLANALGLVFNAKFSHVETAS